MLLHTSVCIWNFGLMSVKMMIHMIQKEKSLYVRINKAQWNWVTVSPSLYVMVLVRDRFINNVCVYMCGSVLSYFFLFSLSLLQQISVFFLLSFSHFLMCVTRYIPIEDTAGDWQDAATPMNLFSLFLLSQVGFRVRREKKVWSSFTLLKIIFWLNAVNDINFFLYIFTKTLRRGLWRRLRGFFFFFSLLFFCGLSRYRLSIFLKLLLLSFLSLSHTQNIWRKKSKF